MTVAGPSVPDRHQALLASLRERPEIQVTAAYLGSAWLLYEAAGLVVFVFDLPDAVLRWFVLLLGIGAVLALLLGRWLRLTVLELRKGLSWPEADIVGVPDFLEPMLVRASRTVSRRTTLLTISSSTVLFLLLFFFLWSSWASAHERQIEDSRIAVLVLPFAEAGAGAQGMGSGVSDLLSTTLDGTQGLRVVDPLSVRTESGGDRQGALAEPGPDQARALGARFGADRVVTGSLLSSGSRLEISARIHDVAAGGAAGQLHVSAHQDSLSAALGRLAVDIVASVWRRGQLPTVPLIDRSATSSADALKAYLDAKDAVWRGQLDEAQEAVERAVALDSTFALAYVEQADIRTWLLLQQAEPLTGVRPILDHAARYADRLTPRNRMRIDAERALNDTDGRTAAFLFDRILSIDSVDVSALEGLASAHQFYGWQMGRGWNEVIDDYRRIIRSDSTNRQALASLARLELWRGNTIAAQEWLRRLTRVDTRAYSTRAALGSMRVLAAPESDVDSLLTEWAQEEIPVVTTVLRDLRISRPDLAQRFAVELTADSMPVYHRAVGLGAQAQLLVATGRFSAMDSLLASGATEGLRSALDVYFVSAALAGIGDSTSAAPAAAALAAETPLDSLEAYLETRDVWITEWAVGAFHATFGDTAEARRWREGLASLPPGETTVPEWPSSLAADIEARLAARRGDLGSAERWAQRAFDQWKIHGWDVFESQPEPAMRFHLAQLLQARGATASAEPLYRSLCPPVTWMGFLTARASLELGRILEERGELEEAATRYRAAEALWRLGDPDFVGDWLEEARAGVARTTG